MMFLFHNDWVKNCHLFLNQLSHYLSTIKEGFFVANENFVSRVTMKVVSARSPI
jgi:hypothetical protein